MTDERDDETVRSIGDFARRVPLSWWLPVPGVVIHALVLLFSKRVWTTVIETSSRSGRSGTTIDAHRHLIFLALAVIGYAAVAFVGEGSSWGRRRMSPPTEGELVVARAMLRGLCLVGLYLSAFALLRNYVFA